MLLLFQRTVCLQKGGFWSQEVQDPCAAGKSGGATGFVGIDHRYTVMIAESACLT